MSVNNVEIFRAGATWIAHRPNQLDHDCVVSIHGMGDCDIAALRDLRKQENN